MKGKTVQEKRNQLTGGEWGVFRQELGSDNKAEPSSSEAWRGLRWGKQAEVGRTAEKHTG